MSSEQIAPDEAFAEYARFAMEQHDEWDAPHFFHTLHYKDGQVYPAIIACIVPSFPPEHYPAAMFKIAAQDTMENDDPPACGYMLQYEAWSSPNATLQERRDKTIHKRDDAREVCSVMIMSVEGKVWELTKYRDTGEIREQTWNAHGQAPAVVSSESGFYQALLAASGAQGAVHFDIIPPRMGGSLN